MRISRLTEARPWTRVDGFDDETGEAIAPYEWRAMASTDYRKHVVFQYRVAA